MRACRMLIDDLQTGRTEALQRSQTRWARTIGVTPRISAVWWYLAKRDYVSGSGGRGSSG